MNTELEKHFETIFNYFIVDEIFLWTYNRNGIAQTIVQVHTHNKQRSSTLRERCERALRPTEGYHFSFYNTKEVQSRINDGLGRLHLNCQPKNRIYVNPEPINTIILPDISIEQLLEQTRDYIKREKDKIIAFMEGYNLYYSKENYPNAAFMLHQTLEISLRVAQKLLLGVEERSHSLKQNIDFFRPYDTILSTLISNKEEEQAINRLTESYTGSRYKNNFTMELEKIEFCKTIADRILLWIADYERELLQEIEEKLSPIQALHQETDIIKTKTAMKKSTNINNNHRDLILNALETYGQVHGLYCFAYVTRQDSMCNLLNIQQSHKEIHHYYLFAIMSNQSRPIMDLQNCAMQLLPEKIKVTLIQETPEQLEKKLKKGDLFRTNLLQAGECWYSDRSYNAKSEQFEETDNNLSSRMSIWAIHKYNAYQLETANNQSYGDLESNTTAYLLCLSLEQTCLGLIKEHLQYKPSSTNLTYLMELCDIICPAVTSIFFRHHKYHADLFHLLIEAQNKYRHSTKFDPNSIDIETMEKKVSLFNNGAKAFMEDYFQQQKELQEAKKTENAEQCA